MSISYFYINVFELFINIQHICYVKFSTIDLFVVQWLGCQVFNWNIGSISPEDEFNVSVQLSRLVMSDSHFLLNHFVCFPSLN